MKLILRFKLCLETRQNLIIALLTTQLLGQSVYSQTKLPIQFDLRNVNGKNLVGPVKSQNGGTCWTYGTMAALEGNLLRTGVWTTSGEDGAPLLAEYHLDWWNGFNKHYNADIAPQTGGLTVHQGGDYRVSAAYLARGGAVRKSDGQSYNTAPEQDADSYHRFYVRDIEWLATEDRSQSIDRIKEALMDHGVVGTALDWSQSFYSATQHTFYQPPSSTEKPNHAVAIVGWDDQKVTQAPEKGAWLIKNSWGPSWGDQGFFWISYFDKTAGHHPEMGAIAFKNVEPLSYSQIYFHDYHGWRDTKTDLQEALNAFTANANEKLTAVSFYTATNQAEYRVEIHKSFEGGSLGSPHSVTEGVYPNQGLHTVTLDWPVPLKQGEKFYVYVKLNKGGHAFDRTSDVPVLLGGGTRTIVESTASAGESFYRTGKQWVDLTLDEPSSNFCIKALTL